MVARDGESYVRSDVHGFCVIATTTAQLFMQCRDKLTPFYATQCVTHQRSLETVILDVTPSLLIIDSELPGIDGTKGIEALVSINPALKILVLEKKKSDENALAMLRAGAVGYCQVDEIEPNLRRACRAIDLGEIWAARHIVSKLVNEMRMQCGGLSQEVMNKLTPRETDITKLVSEGLCQKDIALNLDISENTVRNHLQRIFDKTGVSSRLQLALLVKDA